MQNAYRLSSTLSDSYQDKTTTLMIKKRNVYDIKHCFCLFVIWFSDGGICQVCWRGDTPRSQVSKFLPDSFDAGIVKYRR